MYPYEDSDPSFGEEARQRHIVVLKCGCTDEEVSDHLDDVLQNHNRACTSVGYSPDGLSCQFSCGSFRAYCGEFLPDTINYIENRPEVSVEALQIIVAVTEPCL